MAAPYPEAVRIGAVAALLAGEDIYSVSARTGVDRTTLIRWRRESEAAVQHFHTRTRERMAHALYDTVIDILAGVRSVSGMLQDPAWATKQSAAELAPLVAAISDRGIRLLGGVVILERQQADGPDPQGQPPAGGQPEGDGDYVP